MYSINYNNDKTKQKDTIVLYIRSLSSSEKAKRDDSKKSQPGQLSRAKSHIIIMQQNYYSKLSSSSEVKSGQPAKLLCYKRTYMHN